MNPATYLVAILSILQYTLVTARPTTDSSVEVATEYPTEITNIVTYPPPVVEPEVTVPPEFELRREEPVDVVPVERVEENVIPVVVREGSVIPTEVRGDKVVPLEALPVQEQMKDWEQQNTVLVRAKRYFIAPFFSKMFMAKKFIVHKVLKAFTGFGMGLRPPFFG